MTGGTRAGRRPPPAWALAAPLLSVLLAGCTGSIELGPEPDQHTPGGDPGGDPGQLTERPSVTLPSARVKLLPFDVRLRRIAAGVGVSADDAIFDAARGQRLALGAHDFINGVAPDLDWNAQRMAAWITVMLPVCRDARVRSSLGEWRATGVARFVERAFGRASTPDDLDDLAAPLAISGDDGWVATCLSLVSSAEVLLQ